MAFINVEHLQIEKRSLTPFQVAVIVRMLDATVTIRISLGA